METALTTWAIVIMFMYMCTGIIGFECSTAFFGYENAYWIPAITINCIECIIFTSFTVDVIKDTTAFNWLNIIGIITVSAISIAQMIATYRNMHHYHIVAAYYDIVHPSLENYYFHHPGLKNYEINRALHLNQSANRHARAKRMRIYQQKDPLIWL